MRSDNATQNAMQWKCIALRRTAARKLPLLPPYGRGNQESLNYLFQCLYSTRLVSIRNVTNPFLGGFTRIYRSKLLPAFWLLLPPIHERDKLAFKLLLQSLQLLLQSLH